MNIVRYANIFGLYFPVYGWLVGFGLAAILIHFCWQVKHLPIERERADRLLIAFPFAMLTGLFFAFLWDAFFRETWRTWFSGGQASLGFTYFGWLFGVIFFYCIYGCYSKIGVRFLLNLYLPSFALAQALGRVGCFLGGCCYGCPSERFGIRYPEGSLPYCEVGDVALFPIQLVEASILLLLFIVVCRLAFRCRAMVYLFGVSVERFVVEFFRYDGRGDVLEMSVLSPGQWFSVFYFTLACVLAVGTFLPIKK